MRFLAEIVIQSMLAKKKKSRKDSLAAQLSHQRTTEKKHVVYSNETFTSTHDSSFACRMFYVCITQIRVTMVSFKNYLPFPSLPFPFSLSLSLPLSFLSNFVSPSSLFISLLSFLIAMFSILLTEASSFHIHLVFAELTHLLQSTFFIFLDISLLFLQQIRTYSNGCFHCTQSICNECFSAKQRNKEFPNIISYVLCKSIVHRAQIIHYRSVGYKFAYSSYHGRFWNNSMRWDEKKGERSAISGRRELNEVKCKSCVQA